MDLLILIWRKPMQDFIPTTVLDAGWLPTCCVSRPARRECREWLIRSNFDPAIPQHSFAILLTFQMQMEKITFTSNPHVCRRNQFPTYPVESWSMAQGKAPSIASHWLILYGSSHNITIHLVHRLDVFHDCMRRTPFKASSEQIPDTRDMGKE